MFLFNIGSLYRVKRVSQVMRNACVDHGQETILFLLLLMSDVPSSVYDLDHCPLLIVEPCKFTNL